MKIDSIFSTFDKKIDCVQLQLDLTTPLLGDNLLKVRCAFQTYIRLLVDVVGGNSPTFLWGKVSSFFTCIRKVPLLEMQACLDYVHTSLITSEYTLSATQFKAEFFGRYGSKKDDVGTLVWAFINTNVMNVWSGKPHAYPCLAHLCKFLSKISLDRPELELDCIQSYLECEDYIASHQDYPNSLVRELNRILQEWLRDYNPTFLPVRHGRGSVADCKPYQLDKYRHLATDARLNLGIKWLHGYSPCDYFPRETSAVLVRTSKYITVPKSLTKRRGISMEPATLQYFQQGVMLTLYDYICSRLPQIPLTMQSVNQTCAFLGSKFSYYCTVDLSNASDLVSYKLVKRLFRGTHLMKYIMATRSDHTKLSDGRIVELLKFAPMGSALCFPIESLIFASCCEFVSRYARDRWGLEDISYSVYGDDMVINNCLYGALVTCLHALGFKVNHDKSFFKGPFRESCGAEFRNGVDVTPLKYRLDVLKWDHIAPNDYSAICACVNSCAESGLLWTRRFLLSKIIQTKPGPLFVDDFGFSPFIYSSHATNFNNKCRWNRDYFRKEIFYLTVKSRADVSLIRQMNCNNPEELDDILYLKWLIQHEYTADINTEFAPDKYSLVTKDTVYHRGKYLW